MRLDLIGSHVQGILRNPKMVELWHKNRQAYTRLYTEMWANDYQGFAQVRRLLELSKDSHHIAFIHGPRI
jgi:hypothetical protein